MMACCGSVGVADVMACCGSKLTGASGCDRRAGKFPILFEGGRGEPVGEPLPKENNGVFGKPRERVRRHAGVWAARGAGPGDAESCGVWGCCGHWGGTRGRGGGAHLTRVRGTAWPWLTSLVNFRVADGPAPGAWHAALSVVVSGSGSAGSADAPAGGVSVTSGDRWCVRWRCVRAVQF